MELAFYILVLYCLISGSICSYKFIRSRKSISEVFISFIMGFYILPTMVLLFGIRAFTKKWNGNIWNVK